MKCKMITAAELAGVDILLVIPPPFFTRMPHLGVAHLATFLRDRGFAPEVFDLNLLLHNKADDSQKTFWQMECTNNYFVTQIADRLSDDFRAELDQFIGAVVSSGVKVIGFSVNIISIFLANRIAREIKRRDPAKKIVFGGAGTFFKHPRELIEPGFVDYFVIGEGEITLARLLDALRRGERLASGPGLLLGTDNGRRQAQPPALVNDLNTIPSPTYSEFDLPEYNQGSEYRPLPLLMSRGCINRCSYCIDCIMWPRYRVRDAQHIFGEIEHHCRIHRARAFEFNDLLCNGDLRRLGALCDLIIASGLKFDWVSYAVIRKDMDAGLLAKMKKAGCHTLIYGLEHTSPCILGKMRKNYTADDALRLIRDTHQAGICASINIILGFPGETEGDVDQVLDFLTRNKAYIHEVTNVSACTLFPAADLGVNKKKYGIRWQEGTDPILFTDAQGLGRDQRNQRVARMLVELQRLGLSRAIVNTAALNPQVKSLLDGDRND